MADTIKTVNKTKLSNGEIRYYEDSFARENIAELNTTVNDISVEVDTKQNKLIAGDNILIEGDVISASATSDYNKLENKPTLNGKEIVGDLSTSDLDIKTSELINDEGFLTSDSVTAGNGISIVDGAVSVEDGVILNCGTSNTVV